MAFIKKPKLSLHEAVEAGNEKLVQYLVETGYNVNDVDSKDRTPLHYTASRLNKFAPINEEDFQCRVRIAKLLINAGAKVDSPSCPSKTDDNLRTFIWDYTTPLQEAASCQNVAMVKLLLEHGADVQAKSRERGNTALHYAVCQRNVNLVKILLEHGSDANAINAMGETPLHLAVKCTRRESLALAVKLIELLLEYGADVNKKREYFNDTPFQMYIDQCHGFDPTILKLLLVGKNREDNRMSPLHEACMFHRVDLVRDLLREGADVAAEDSFGNQPMIYALIASKQPTDNDDKRATLKLLLDYGADDDQSCLFPDIGFTRFGSNIRDIFNDYAIKRVVLHYFSVDNSVQCLEGLTLSKFAFPQSLNDDMFSFESLVRRFVQSRMGVMPLMRQELFNELRLMKETKIGESEISFLDVLDASPGKMANYLSIIKQLIEDFEVGKSKFKNYWGILEASFYKGCTRMKLAKSAAETLSVLLCSDYSLETYFQKYVAHYSNEELNLLIE